MNLSPRADTLRNMATVDLYLPSPGTPAVIAQGSGIVASILDGERLRVDFEGDLFRMMPDSTFADRCLHAADRHLTNYPTVARVAVRADTMRYIGTYDTVFGEAHLAEGAEPLLARWLGVEQLDHRELMTTQSVQQHSLRTVRTWPTAKRRSALGGLSASDREAFTKAGLL